MNLTQCKETLTDLHEPAASQQLTTESDIISSFTDFSLDARLERAIRDAGYKTPTPVQAGTIPVALSGHDLIGTAQTGTGKTAAFVLPILQRLLTTVSKRRSTRVIVLTPTRELAEQVNDTFRQFSKYTKIRSAVVYGGVGMAPQERALRMGVEIIVACPGRLIDHMERGNTDFSCVENLVLDEADRMLDMGFLPPIKRILSRLPETRQSMLFSATFAPELTRLTDDAMNSPQMINIGLSAPAETIEHSLYPCTQLLKTDLVIKLLESVEAKSVLIFTRTKTRADRVAQQIRNAGYKAAAMHANKTQSQRQMILNDFKLGRFQILIATDIAARGLDVQSISHVINYDVPDCADSYIHRIGRTGRAERGGDAITLVTWEDSSIVRDIERSFGKPIERKKLENFDYGNNPLIDFKMPTPANFRRGVSVTGAFGNMSTAGSESIMRESPVVVYATSRNRSKRRRSVI
ncbi:MAG: DEAD/DEAH box helicase [Armatimonadota bacterium]